MAGRRGVAIYETRRFRFLNPGFRNLREITLTDSNDLRIRNNLENGHFALFSPGVLRSKDFFEPIFVFRLCRKNRLPLPGRN